MKVNFEIGKEYRCVGLYGGEYIIKVVSRTNDKIFFVYNERTSDDRSIQSATIEVETVTVYGKNLEELGKELGITKERVRQIKEQGLKKLRSEILLIEGADFIF